MESTELKDNVEIQNWFSRIKASGNTKQSYLQALQAFTKMAGKAPEQLILEAEAEVRGVNSWEKGQSGFTFPSSGNLWKLKNWRH